MIEYFMVTGTALSGGRCIRLPEVYQIHHIGTYYDLS